MQSNDPDNGRMKGTLVEICANGYGFLYVGKRKPDYFILRKDLPPEAWVKGAVIRFTPAPPSQRNRRPRAIDPEVVAMPEEDHILHEEGKD